MAKKETLDNGQPVNKSQAIRDVFAENPRPRPRPSSTGSPKGSPRLPTMVYYVRSKRLAKKARSGRVAESSEDGDPNPVELVLRVKDMAREVGGIRNLKQLVDLLAE